MLDALSGSAHRRCRPLPSAARHRPPHFVAPPAAACCSQLPPAFARRPRRRPAADVAWRINFHLDLGIFGTQTCSLACLVASLWRPGRPWADPGTLGSTRENTWGSRLELLLIFVGFRDPILRVCWVPWTKQVCLFMLVSSFLFW